MNEGVEEVPAWSLGTSGVARIMLPSHWPDRVTREGAFGGSTGKGVRVCVVDSGIDPDHPRVGPLAGSMVVTRHGNEAQVEEDVVGGDACGHGTACAGIIRSLAPDCSLYSVRVLGPGYSGSGAALLAGLRWAIEQDFDVVNLSISTTRREFAATLHELADRAYFRRTILVASAHNMPVVSYPWRFSSVISVASHDQADPLAWYYNPNPPVEFFARGVNVAVASPGGGTIRCTGNSFATPHMTGICALVLAKHHGLTPFQLKSVLHLTATNVGGGHE